MKFKSVIQDKIGLVSIICAACVVVAKPAFATDDVFSFRKVMANERQNSQLVKELGAECVKAVNQVTAEGKTLKSSTLARSLVPLSMVHWGAARNDFRFYHWTKAEGLLNLFELNQLSGGEASEKAKTLHRYDELFYFLAERPASNYKFWRRVFYVANDTESTKYLGSYLLEFELNPQAKTLSYDQKVWDLALKEIGRRYPEIRKHCDLNLDMSITDTYGSLLFNSLLYVIAEDSGAEVVDFNQDRRWFQLLNAKAFVSVKKVN